MPYIYHPTGRAAEYVIQGDGTPGWALNPYTGCDHGCTYCYARSMHNRFRPNISFDNPIPRIDLAKLECEAARLETDHDPIHVAFTCDPFPLHGDEKYIRQVFSILDFHGHGMQILSKGGARAECVLPSLSTVRDNYGATLTFIEPADSRQWEPNAALPIDRIETLKEFHRRGFKTWASLEPVIDPAQSLEIINICSGFVDLFKLGMLNYRKSDIHWKNYLTRAKALLENAGKRYIIKKDLLDAAGEE